MDERCNPINKFSQWQHLSSQSQYPMTLENHDGLPMKLPQPRRSSSHTIPLPSSHIPRTQSELQLCDDMAAAEWRDLCMFHRVVNGIREKHRRSDGLSVTMFERSTEGCPTHSNLHGSPSSRDEWSISGYSDDRMDKTMPHHQLPRQSIPWPSTTSSSFVIEQSKNSLAEKTSYLDDDAVFSLDLWHDSYSAKECTFSRDTLPYNITRFHTHASRYYALLLLLSCYDKGNKHRNIYTSSRYTSTLGHALPVDLCLWGTNS